MLPAPTPCACLHCHPSPVTTFSSPSSTLQSCRRLAVQWFSKEPVFSCNSLTSCRLFFTWRSWSCQNQQQLLSTPSRGGELHFSSSACDRTPADSTGCIRSCLLLLPKSRQLTRMTRKVGYPEPRATTIFPTYPHPSRALRGFEGLSQT